MALDNSREVSAQAASALEAAHHCVIVVDELQPDRGSELVGFVSGEAVTACDEAHDRVHQRQVLHHEAFVIHGVAADLSAQRRGIASRPGVFHAPQGVVSEQAAVKRQGAVAVAIPGSTRVVRSLLVDFVNLGHFRKPLGQGFEDMLRR
jgi:hypothetical protein